MQAAAARYFASFLDKYVRADDQGTFSERTLELALWSGVLVLHNLDLNPNVFPELAVSINRAFIGTVEIKIDWKRLRSQPVEVVVSDGAQACPSLTARC